MLNFIQPINKIKPGYFGCGLAVGTAIGMVIKRIKRPEKLMNVVTKLCLLANKHTVYFYLTIV
jgi:hypothetical protein